MMAHDAVQLKLDTQQIPSKTYIAVDSATSIR